jgi:hypothetical protein
LRLRIGLLAGVFVVAGLAAGAGSAAALGPVSFTCLGTPAHPAPIPGGTYLSLSMPAGSACPVVGPVTVLSPVALGAGSTLAVLASGSFTSIGSLTVGPGAVFADANNAAPVTVNGPVLIQDNAAFNIGFEQPGHTIISAIHGSVTAINPSSVHIHNTLVAGSLNIQGGGGDNPLADFFAGPGTNFTALEDNTILGPVTEVGYAGIWAGVIRNAIFGPFTFSNNTNHDEFDIGSNVIYGSATCNDNNPAPNTGHSPGSPSTVHGPSLGNQAATCTGV